MSTLASILSSAFFKQHVFILPKATWASEFSGVQGNVRLRHEGVVVVVVLVWVTHKSSSGREGGFDPTTQALLCWNQTWPTRLSPLNQPPPHSPDRNVNWFWSRRSWTWQGVKMGQNLFSVVGQIVIFTVKYSVRVERIGGANSIIPYFFPTAYPPCQSLLLRNTLGKWLRELIKEGGKKFQRAVGAGEARAFYSCSNFY